LNQDYFLNLTIPSHLSAGDGMLGVGSFGSPTVFHTIRLFEISGAGKPLP
jgi:hypothetical protein